MTGISAPALTTFAVYLAVMLGIGAWVYRSTVDLSDYVLGDRGLGSGTAALSAQASDMSGWLLLGLPGAVYSAGVGASWIGIGLLLGAYLNWKFVAARLRTYTEYADDAVTLSAYFEGRFGDRTHLLRLFSALFTIVFFCFYVASGLVAGGLLFEQVFGLNVNLAITLSVLVIVAYTFLGGFLAVSYTDALQGTLMVAALIVLPLVALVAIGGPGDLASGLQARAPGLLSMGTEASYSRGDWSSGSGLSLIVIGSSLAWGLGYFGQPHILARFMGIRSSRHVPLGRRIATSWVGICLLGAVLTGLAGIVFLDTPLANPETVFLRLIQQTLNPWIGGVLLAAVLAAIMSTADSQLLVASSSLTEDIYRTLFNREASDTTLLWMGRAATVAVAIVAYLLALRGGTVLSLVAYAWAGFGATFGPVVILSLWWSRMTFYGALAGMISGAATVLLWEAVQPFGGDVYSMIPGVAISAMCAVVFSRFGSVPGGRDWGTAEELPGRGPAERVGAQPD